MPHIKVRFNNLSRLYTDLVTQIQHTHSIYSDIAAYRCDTLQSAQNLGHTGIDVNSIRYCTDIGHTDATLSWTVHYFTECTDIGTYGCHTISGTVH